MAARIWVRDRRVKGGGYWRKAPVSKQRRRAAAKAGSRSAMRKEARLQRVKRVQRKPIEARGYIPGEVVPDMYGALGGLLASRPGHAAARKSGAAKKASNVHSIMKRQNNSRTVRNRRKP